MSRNDLRDVYKFSLSKTTKVTVALEARFTGGSYAIYDTDGNAMWQDNGDWYSNGINEETGKFKLTKEITLDKGFYYFSVSALTNGVFEHRGNYNFTLKVPVPKYKIRYKYGSSSYGKTTISYGKTVTLKANQFKKSGYHFTGWTIQRSSDKKWLYQKGSTLKWYKEDKQPSGYKKAIYKNQASIAKTTAVNKDTVYMFARWKKK